MCALIDMKLQALYENDDYEYLGSSRFKEPETHPDGDVIGSIRGFGREIRIVKSDEYRTSGDVIKSVDYTYYSEHPLSVEEEREDLAESNRVARSVLALVLSDFEHYDFTGIKSSVVVRVESWEARNSDRTLAGKSAVIQEMLKMYRAGRPPFVGDVWTVNKAELSAGYYIKFSYFPTRAA